VPAIVVLLLVLSAIATPAAQACKYNVRDVAFVQLHDPPYRLDLYLGKQLDEGSVAALESAAKRALADSNVVVNRLLPVPQPAEIATSEAEALPPVVDRSAILVAPDGRTWPVPLDAPAWATPDAFEQALAALVQSTRTREVMSLVTDVHSVVLVVESRDADQNRLAREMVDEAVRRIESSLPDLPKLIAAPPRVLTIKADDVASEAVLLWSLGVDRSGERATQIAMLFGRGRALGPVLTVGENSQQDVLRSLAVVGLDCECELDRSWMEAPMIPHTWTAADEQHAAQALGFDPGHPLVKVEISRILSRGPRSGDRATADGGELGEADLLLPGLQVIDLDFAEDEAEADLSEIDAENDAGDDAAQQVAADRIAATDTDVDMDTPGSAARADAAGAAGAAGAAPTSTPRTSPSATDVASLAIVLLVGMGVAGGLLVVMFGRRGGS
jgi:hypothetical protein